MFVASIPDAWTYSEFAVPASPDAQPAAMGPAAASAEWVYIGASPGPAFTIATPDMTPDGFPAPGPAPGPAPPAIPPPVAVQAAAQPVAPTPQPRNKEKQVLKKMARKVLSKAFESLARDLVPEAEPQALVEGAPAQEVVPLPPQLPPPPAFRVSAEAVLEPLHEAPDEAPDPPAGIQAAHPIVYQGKLHAPAAAPVGAAPDDAALLQDVAEAEQRQQVDHRVASTAAGPVLRGARRL